MESFLVWENSVASSAEDLFQNVERVCTALEALGFQSWFVPDKLHEAFFMIFLWLLFSTSLFQNWGSTQFDIICVWLVLIKDLSHQDLFPLKDWLSWGFITVTGNRVTSIYPYVSQGGQSPVWWWLMYGVTCPCWTTGIWCLGWRWPAADTTVWCTMANSTPLEVWVCRETWIMWRGKIHT